jgi:hypothetical protein
LIGEGLDECHVTTDIQSATSAAASFVSMGAAVDFGVSRIISAAGQRAGNCHAKNGLNQIESLPALIASEARR